MHTDHSWVVLHLQANTVCLSRQIDSTIPTAKLPRLSGPPFASPTPNFGNLSRGGGGEENNNSLQGKNVTPTADFPGEGVESSSSRGGNCACGFRLAVCRGCRQLPKGSGARRGGTLGFRPPEVMMRHVQQSTAVDVWAAGVILLSFLSGRYPFIKVDDDLDVLHAFTHLLGYRRMQAAAKSLGRRILVQPKPAPLEPSETPVTWLKARLAGECCTSSVMGS